MSGVRHRRRLGPHTLWLLAARIGSQAGLVLFTVVVARRLGTAGLGEYAFVAAVVFVANALTSFGTDMLLVREVAARGDLGGLPAALVAQLALSAAVVALGAVVAPLVPGQSADAVVALRVALVALLPLAAYTVFAAMLRGLARITEYALLNLAVAALQLALAVAAVPPGSSVVRVAAVLVVTQTAAALLAGALVAARPPGLGAFAADPRPRLRALLRSSAPIALLGLAGTLYQRAPVLVVSAIAGPAATGWLAAGLRAVEAAKTGHIAAYGALYPALAEAGAEVRSPAAFPRALAALLGLAAALAAALSLLAEPLVRVVYGPAFAAAAPALRILAWALVPYTVSSYLSLALVAARREAVAARALLGALATFVVLGSWWLEAAGVAGAAAAVLAAESVQAAALLSQLRGAPKSASVPLALRP